MKDNIKVTIYFTLFILFLVLAFLGYNILANNQKTNGNLDVNNINKESIKEKEKLQEFEITLETGEKISSKELINGTPLVINIWTSWCAYCDIEMEYFNELYVNEKNNINFVMINATGDRDTKERAKEYVKAKGYTFDIYYDLELEAISSLEVYSYPTTIFVDKDGYIESKVVGTISRETLKNKIQSLK